MDLLLILAVGAIVAGFVQGLSGFAFGMVAMSFWAWSVDPAIASVMAVFGALTGQIFNAISVRRSLRLKFLLPFIAGGLLGIPLGVTVLPHLDPPLFKAAFGSLLLLWCPVMLLSQQLPRIAIGGRLADGAIGIIGGMMGGIGGFAGPVPTLWCTLRGFDKDLQRNVIQNFSLTVLLVTMTVYVSSGMVTSDMLPMFAVVAPALLIPNLLGSRLYIGVSETTFRKIVLGLLTASGVAMLASSLPELARRWA